MRSQIYKFASLFPLKQIAKIEAGKKVIHLDLYFAFARDRDKVSEHIIVGWLFSLYFLFAPLMFFGLKFLQNCL